MNWTQVKWVNQSSDTIDARWFSIWIRRWLRIRNDEEEEDQVREETTKKRGTTRIIILKWDWNEKIKVMLNSLMNQWTNDSHSHSNSHTNI